MLRMHNGLFAYMSVQSWVETQSELASALFLLGTSSKLRDWSGAGCFPCTNLAEEKSLWTRHYFVVSGHKWDVFGGPRTYWQLDKKSRGFEEIQHMWSFSFCSTDFWCRRGFWNNVITVKYYSEISVTLRKEVGLGNLNLKYEKSF